LAARRLGVAGGGVAGAWGGRAGEACGRRGGWSLGPATRGGLGRDGGVGRWERSGWERVAGERKEARYFNFELGSKMYGVDFGATSINT
jgi:hypothetical protein